MTTHGTLDGPLNTDLVDALHTVLVGPDSPLHARVREAVLAVRDVPTSGLTYAEQHSRTPGLLRALIREMGGSALDIAGDPRLRGVLFEEAAIAAPSVLTLMSGHLNLALGAILASGIGTEYVQRCATDLDTGAAVGVLMLTELAGTNGPHCRTTATWDPAVGGFRLATPTIGEKPTIAEKPAVEAAKFMPNLAGRSPKIAVVTARLQFDGRDEGVLPFLLRVRDADGQLAPGVRVRALAEKIGSASAMDHGLIVFDPAECVLPREALLGGDWARITSSGEFDCTVQWEQRFARTGDPLGGGRVDLPCGAIATARAALAGVVGYAGQRRPGRTVMIDRGPVQRDIVTALAAVWATSILGRRARELRAAGASPWVTLGPMVAKPLLSGTAFDVLVMCRRRAGAQGILRSNYIPDWIANADGISTAEGDDQIMQVAAGRHYKDLLELHLRETPGSLPSYIEPLIAREHTIAAGMHQGNYGAAGPVWGSDTAAAELTAATGERLAATALHIAAATAPHPAAERLLHSAAAAYALGCIYEHGGWYTVHGLMSAEQATRIHTELIEHRSVLADSMAELVAAFDIPALPGAPLFARDYLDPYRTLTGSNADTAAAVSVRQAS
ncbi:MULTISPECIES: acyl-CoA dehydrogenase family protein [Nocardia]|uniref:acyl-CoA dehydrogenase family protein n=1 Tax=Nocardia TaxID=1817 RepID=UPI0002F50354|nr:MULTISPECIES: acyl-CoA dehydrogenase family protein [Nocardia]